MKPIKHILGCLDLTEIDPVLMRQADFLARAVAAERVTFVHFIQAYDLPDRKNKKFPSELAIKSVVKKTLTQQICDHCGEDIDTHLEVLVEKEDSASGIIEYVDQHEIDLVLIGQKLGLDREGWYVRKIGREVASDFMLVSESADMTISAILCALDGSEESRAAFERARKLAVAMEASLACYFLEDTTRSYFPSAGARKARPRQDRARKDYQTFLEPYQLTPDEVPCYFEAVGPNENQAEKVHEAAEAEQAGLIVTGAKGAVATKTSLLGNIFENFLRLEKTIPVMMIKNKKPKRFFRY